MSDAATDRTEQWLKRVVVGLGLCPFAAPVLADGRLEILVSDAADADTLTADLDHALQRLASTPASQLETTLVVAEHLLGEFDAFNEYLDIADALIEARGLTGVVQLATFHPDYVFADAEADDPANATNRAPYPTLHLLREARVEQAIAKHGNTEAIPVRNARLLRSMTPERWRSLFAD
ncbi:MAG: DUF1415 domain-containing protein [Pseudomonadota bacterium]